MVYCVQGQLAFSGGSRRNAVRTDVESRIAARQRWGVDTLAAVTLRGEPVLLVSLRFVSRLDADDLVARIQAFATGQRRPLAGSWLRVHGCTHDAAGVCESGTRITW